MTFLINGISLSTRLSRQVARACTRTGVASVQELWRRPRREGTGAAVAAMCMARCLGGAQRLSSVRSVNDTLSRISEELATCLSGAPARALPALQSSGDARAESEVRIAARTFLHCVRSMSCITRELTDVRKTCLSELHGRELTDERKTCLSGALSRVSARIHNL